MTMAGITEYPDLFAAGVDLFGIVNFMTFFEHAAVDGRDLDGRIRRSTVEMVRFFEEDLGGE